VGVVVGKIGTNSRETTVEGSLNLCQKVGISRKRKATPTNKTAVPKTKSKTNLAFLFSLSLFSGLNFFKNSGLATEEKKFLPDIIYLGCF